VENPSKTKNRKHKVKGDRKRVIIANSSDEEADDGSKRRFSTDSRSSSELEAQRQNRAEKVIVYF